MLATALAEVKDPDRVSKWGNRLENDLPEVYAQVQVDPSCLDRETPSDEVAITLIMAGYAFHIDPLTLNEAPFEIYVALYDNIQDLFEQLILPLAKCNRFGHITIVLKYGAVPTYTHLYELCERLYYCPDRQGLINQLNLHEYDLNVELMNLNLHTFSLASAYHSTFYEIIAMAPLIALRYIHTPGLNLFGIGKTSLLHLCIDGVGAEDYDEASKDAWVSLFSIIVELEPRMLYITDGIGNSAKRTLKTEIYHAPNNVYFQQMQTCLV